MSKQRYLDECAVSMKQLIAKAVIEPDDKKREELLARGDHFSALVRAARSESTVERAVHLFGDGRVFHPER